MQTTAVFATVLAAGIDARFFDGVRPDQFPILSPTPTGSAAALAAFFGIVLMVGIGLFVIVRKLK